MKKLNYVFTALVALLLFTVVWNTFNTNYALRQSLFYNDKLLNDDQKAINTVVSTHVLDVDIEDVKHQLVDFFVQHDYEGYISHISIGDDLRKSAMIYANFDQNHDYFKFYTLSNRVDMDYKDVREKQYISNDILASDSILIDYLDQSYYTYRDDYERQLMYIHPLHHFLETENSKIRDNQLSINLFVDLSEYEVAMDQLNKEILVPFGIISSDRVDDTGAIFDNTAVLQDSIKSVSLTSLNWKSSLLEMPKPLLIISAVSVLLINIYIMFSKAKEIYIRRMHGNDNFIVFSRVVLPPILITILTFLMTFVLLWFIFVHSFRPLALVFTKQLFIIVGVYIGLMFLMGLLLYIYLHLKNSFLFLKKQLDMSIIFIIITVIKVMAIVVVVIPLVLSYKSLKQYEAGIVAMEKDPVYLSSIGLQGVTQPIYPMSSPKISDKVSAWYEDTHKGIVNLIENQQLSFIDMDYYDVLASSGDDFTLSPFALTNINHIMNYQIKGDDTLIDFTQSEKNFILVPSQYQAHFGKEGVQVEGFESATVHYVDKTYTQFSNYVGHNNQYEDPILYVIVDDYSMVPDFYNALRKVIRNDADLESFNQAMNDFNSNVAQIPRLNAQDVYDQMMVRLKTEKMTFGILFLATLFITTLFTYLMTYTFIEHSKKVLAVKTLHGHKLAKQYRLLFTAYFLSITSIILIITSYNRTIDPWNRSYLAIEPRFMLTIICFVLTIQVLVSISLIQRFQNKSLALILKGEGE